VREHVWTLNIGPIMRRTQAARSSGRVPRAEGWRLADAVGRCRLLSSEFVAKPAGRGVLLFRPFTLFLYYSM